MFNSIKSLKIAASVICVGLFASTAPVASADLGHAKTPSSTAPQNEWSYTFTPYVWIPWLSGDMAVRGRALDVSADPGELFSHLDWSTIPAWMSYAEARRGPLSLFNDIVWSKVSGARSFARSSNRRIINATLGANVVVDFEQATIEAGGAYEIWSGQNPALTGSTSLDVLAGARYWHQESNVSADLATSVNVGDLVVSGNRVIARSGSVDWVDPFVGARLRNRLAPGQELVIRGDVGGFGAGSDFSWQILTTYNWEMCTTNGYLIDGYFGYRVLSVDYSQGSGTTRYEYDVIEQGPVIGATLHF